MAFDVSGPKSGTKQGKVRQSSGAGSVSVPTEALPSQPTPVEQIPNNLPVESPLVRVESKQAKPTTSPESVSSRFDPSSENPALGGVLLSPEQLRQAQPERKRSQRFRRIWLGVGGIVLFSIVVFASIRAMMQTTTTIDALRSGGDAVQNDSETLSLDAFQQGLNDFSELTNPESEQNQESNVTGDDLQRLYETATPGSDTDRDGLTVEQEQEQGTNPQNPDTDGDGYMDGEEVVAGFSPIEAAPVVNWRSFYEDVDRGVEFTYPSSATLTSPVLINGPIASDDQSVPQIKVFEVRSLFDGVEGVGQLPPDVWQDARTAVQSAELGVRIDEQIIPAVPVYGSTLIGDATDTEWLGVTVLESSRGTRGADGWVSFTDRDGEPVLARVTTFFESSDAVVQFVSFYKTAAPDVLLATFSGFVAGIEVFDTSDDIDLVAIDASQEQALKEHDRLVRSVLIR